MSAWRKGRPREGPDHRFDDEAGDGGDGVGTSVLFLIGIAVGECVGLSVICKLTLGVGGGVRTTLVSVTLCNDGLDVGGDGSVSPCFRFCIVDVSVKLDCKVVFLIVVSFVGAMITVGLVEGWNVVPRCSL